MEVHRDRDGNVLHRIDGPALIRHDGSEFWYVHGKLHREDGPAVIYYKGAEAWYLHDKLHRIDGPAVIYPNGTREWWIHGKEVDPMKHLVLTSSNKGV